MKKSRSIVALIILAALTVLLTYTAITGFGPNASGSVRNIHTGLDLSGGVSITYQTVDPNPAQSDLDDTIWKLQQRVEQYSTESQVYQQGLNRICVEIPGVSDANAILEELGKPGALEFQDEEGNKVLDGTAIADAEGLTYTNSTTGLREYIVSLTMTSEAASEWAEITKENLDKRIAIVYDGQTVSAPYVRSVITGGQCQIEGMADLDEAKELAAYIRIGSLSLELEEIYSNVVGASLGQEALSTSLKAGIIGIILVMLFMIFVYRVSGIAAAWALYLFALLDLLLINAFEVTLTLPGIAGVILTIGMAVDANVIIYARVREELFAGRSLMGALQEGFKKAFSAIFDSNITTLIAAAVLYALGTGSIRGFAVTLALGIVLSMFSSLVISRLISYSLYGIGIRKVKAYTTVKDHRMFNFVDKRKIFFTIAIILIVLAPVGMLANKGMIGKAMNYGLDFVGGTSTTVDFGEELTLEQLEADVQPIVSNVTGDSSVTFQQVTGTTQVVIKTNELSLDQRTQLNEDLIAAYPAIDKDNIQAENISSTISGEMRANAVRAVIIAVICMLLYIWLRFRNIRFASSAVIALIHDLFVVLAFYCWFKLSVNSSFIAVMLTILGYSINATIVIFDRIRENLKIMPGTDLKTIVNSSISQTLTRSIYSNLTTFITIFVLFILGVPSIRDFSLPIIIGLIAGAYSSIFVTGSLWYVLSKKKYERNTKKK